MKRPIKPLLIGSGLAALGAAAVGAASVAATNQLVRIALDRELPTRFRENGKARARLTGSPENHGALERLALAGKELQSKVVRRVTVYGRDGTVLVGHWRPCPSPKRVILAMHGWRSSWHRDFGIVADFWYEQGCSVLFAEQRGQGSSGGAHMSFGMMERYDCLTWAQWLHRNVSGTLPIYLAGVSMGATTVLMASGQELPENVIGILADCGYTSAREIIHKILRQIRLPIRLVYPFVKLGARLFAGFDLEQADARKAVQNCTRPVIFYHGDGDDFVPWEMSRDNHAACPSRKKLVIIPGAGHGLSFPADQERYVAELREFFGPEASAD